MILEGFLSSKVVGLQKSILEDIKSTFLNRYEKVVFLEEDITAILNLMKYDKKNSHGKVNFVLLKSIGEPEIDVEIPVELFTEAFAYYKD
jgi:3-dehydroquinate synthase